MSAQLRIGSIYSFFYTTWKTNIKVYAFILYSGPNSPHVHAINLAAQQLTNYDKIKLITTIKKLASVNNATFYNGQLLYKIFKTYLYDQIKKSYRTYHKKNIQRVALINYGINKPSEFSITEMKNIDVSQFNIAQRDIVVKMMNLYTQKGVKLSEVRDKFAKLTTSKDIGTEVNVVNKIVKQDQSKTTALKSKPSIITTNNSDEQEGNE